MVTRAVNSVKPKLQIKNRKGGSPQNFVTMKPSFYIKEGVILIEKDIYREMGKIILTFLIIALLGWITILMEDK